MEKKTQKESTRAALRERERYRNELSGRNVQKNRGRGSGTPQVGTGNLSKKGLKFNSPCSITPQPTG